MPLCIIVKPQERLIVNGAVIRNGGRHNASILIETRCQFLRESELVYCGDAATPAEKLCLTLQEIYLAEDTSALEQLFFTQALQLVRDLPGVAPILLKIQEALAAKETFAAIKLGKQLRRHELEHLMHHDDVPLADAANTTVA
jgi:flagellar biosynthesis repressor protein FlbT